MKEVQKGGRRSGVQSVEVGALVLRAFADAAGPLPLGEIARFAKMSPGKAHRYLVSFVETGLAVQSSTTGDYDLGPLATRLGLAAIDRFDVVRICGERLNELRDAVDATCFIALWTDAGPTVARIALSAHPVTLAVRAGASFPLLDTATGHIFVAYGDRVAIDRYCTYFGVAGSSLDNITARVRATGVASVNETFMVGVRAVAIPIVHGDGRLAASLTVIGGGSMSSMVDNDSPTVIALKLFSTNLLR